MKLNEHILLWNHVFIQVMDVRHKKMDKGEELKLQTSGQCVFIYCTRKCAGMVR